MKNFKKAILILLCLVFVLAVYTGCARTYKVSYYDNGKLINTMTVNSGKTTNRPVNPTKEGYVFEGWYENQSLTRKFDFDEKISKDTSVYAKFITTSTNKNND
ncbi:MAG TPA: InlB B-repeat-containing protein [Clostridia bacterium]|nr:InlB B-repeat-containing protein [Clostridia bacterium]